MTSLWISAGIRTKLGASPETAAIELFKLQQQTLHERGCQKFEIYQHNDESGKFTLWEQWDDQAALELHFTLPHTKAYLALDLTELVYIEKMHPVSDSSHIEKSQESSL